MRVRVRENWWVLELNFRIVKSKSKKKRDLEEGVVLIYLTNIHSQASSVK